MVKIGRIFDINQVKCVKYIKGVPMVLVKAVFYGLEVNSETSLDNIEVVAIAYVNKPIVTIDTPEYKFSGRAKQKIVFHIRKYLESWNGTEFDQDSLKRGVISGVR